MPKKKQRKTSPAGGQARQPSRHSSAAYVYVPAKVLVALGAALLSLAVVAVLLAIRAGGVNAPSNGSQPSQSQSPQPPGDRGPWGDLVCTRVFLDIPEEFVAERLREIQPARWHFAGYSWDRLDSLFRSAGLTDSQRAAVLGTAQSEPAGAGFILAPSQELLLSMSPQTRKAIYSALADDPRNEDQVEPQHCRADLVDEWLKSDELSGDTVALVKRLLYPQGSGMLFGDAQMVMLMLPSAAEKRALWRTVARNTTMMARLRVGPGADVDALARYWGAIGREKELLPLLTSLSKAPGGGSVGITNLLPPLARRRLYTYPFDRVSAARQNCYWTAFNFFNDPPDDRFADLEYTSQFVKAHYVQVAGGPSRFGDVLLMMKSDAEAIHACVYLAGDIVFTKNGPGQTSPWTLMELKDVEAVYPRDEGTQLRVYRLKGL